MTPYQSQWSMLHYTSVTLVHSLLQSIQLVRTTLPIHIPPLHAMVHSGSAMSLDQQLLPWQSSVWLPVIPH